MERRGPIVKQVQQVKHNYFLTDGVNLLAIRTAVLSALDKGESSIVHDHAFGQECNERCMYHLAVETS